MAKSGILTVNHGVDVWFTDTLSVLGGDKQVLQTAPDYKMLWTHVSTHGASLEECYTREFSLRGEEMNTLTKWCFGQNPMNTSPRAPRARSVLPWPMSACGGHSAGGCLVWHWTCWWSSVPDAALRHSHTQVTTRRRPASRGRGGKEIFERCKRTMTQVTSNWLARRLQLWRCQPTKHRMAAKPSHQPLSDAGAVVSSQMQPQSKNGPSFTSTDHQQDCRRCRLGQPPTVTAGLPGLPFACASQPPPRDCWCTEAVWRRGWLPSAMRWSGQNASLGQRFLPAALWPTLGKWKACGQVYHRCVILLLVNEEDSAERLGEMRVGGVASCDRASERACERVWLSVALDTVVKKRKTLSSSLGQNRYFVLPRAQNRDG